MKFRKYLQAIRPKTLLVSLGPVIVGLGLSGRDATNDNLLIAFTIIATALLLQIAANLSNDYFDQKNQVDPNKKLGPKNASSMSLKQIQQGYRTAFLIATALGVFLAFKGGLPIIIIGLASLLFAYLYTGGPHPLSYRSFGEILALVFFGPVAVWGTWYLMTDKVELLPAIVGLGPGFIAWSLMAINNMRDRVSDIHSGKITLAVLVGEKASRLFVLVGIVISIEIPFYLTFVYDNNLLLLCSLVFIPFYKTWLRIAFRPVNVYQNKSLFAISYYSFVYCLVLGAVFLISGS